MTLRKKYQTTSERRASGEPASDAVRDGVAVPFRARNTDSAKGSEHDATSSNTPAFSVTSFSPKIAQRDSNRSSRAIAVPEEAASGQSRLGTVGDIVASNPTLTGPIEARTATQAPSLDPINEEPTLFPEANFALQGLQEDFWDGGNYDPAWFNINPELYYGNNNNSCGFIPNAHIVDEVDRRDIRSTTEPTAGTPGSGIGSSAFRYAISRRQN